MPTWRYRAFGLGLESSFPLPGMELGGGGAAPPLSLELAPALDAAPPQACLWRTLIDGREVTVSRGGAGDHLITYARRAGFWLSPDKSRLVCAPSDVDDPWWLRFLLDTVLSCAGLLRGFEGLHASAVDTEAGVAAFVAGSGGGKTTLAAELVRRGHPFFSDDVLMLEPREEAALAHPGPALMNVPLAAWRPELGERQATLGEEIWVAVRRGSVSPRPLAAVFVLERASSLELELAPEAASPVSLVPHALGLRIAPERARTRFELLGDLAARTPLYLLRSDPATSPHALAELVEAALAPDAVAGCPS